MNANTRSKLYQIAQRACSNLATVFASYSIAKALIEEGVPGDFVECGVFAGSQSATMALAIMDAGAKDRHVHLFDSFQGIPKAGPKDDAIRSLVGGTEGELVSSGISSCSRACVMKHMSEWQINPALLKYHEGWFQDTVPVVAPTLRSIALLRLDGDLYESYMVCLKHLHPLVPKGGWVIADDYGLDGARAAVNQFLGSEVIYWRRT